VQLFVRDSTGTSLTPAGQLLLAEGSPLTSGAQALVARLARLARGTDIFTVGFMPGLTVTAPVRALAAAHPEVQVMVLRTTWLDQVDVLHDGRVDVGYVRMPIDTVGLHTEHLFSEPRLAAVPRGHRLANRDGIRLAELAGENMLQHPSGKKSSPTAPRTRPTSPAWTFTASRRNSKPSQPDAASVSSRNPRLATTPGLISPISRLLTYPTTKYDSPGQRTAETH
jgi:DNA-binding transcriptional LysR family regulator